MRATRLNLTVGLAVIGGLVSCGGSNPPPETVAPPPPAPAEPAPADAAAADTEPMPAEQTEARPKPDVPPAGSPVERIMQAHFKDALLIREAVIAGNLANAADPAHALTRIQNLDDLPEGWRGFVERMQQSARRIEDSTSTAQAAAAAADLGVSCGMCHQQQGGPKASTEPAPAEGTTVESRMKRHVWATERLWEGLSVPSDDAWNAGAKALSTNPFPQEVLKDGGVHARSAAGDFAKIVAKAPTKKTIDERAALYADLLVTCGTCHQAMMHTE